MYKRLQEYNTSLQQYNSKLQSELATTNDALKRVEKEKAAVVENLSTLRGHYTSLQEQLSSFRVNSVKFCFCIVTNIKTFHLDRFLAFASGSFFYQHFSWCVRVSH